jgi:diadenosine tetraphosphate (Ap4A) HIT family hydrolase
MPYKLPDHYPCPFCEYVAGRLEFVPLLENATAIAEISDCERSKDGGAILLWPKTHVETISQLSVQEAHDVAQLIFQTMSGVLNALRPSGFHTFCSAGTLVGQSVAHVHFQIQPRYSDRPYSLAPGPELPTITLADRELMAERIRPHVTDRPQEELIHQLLDFRTSRILDIGSLSSKKEFDDDLVIAETSHFVAMCHPQSRCYGAVLVIAKRDASCFLSLFPNERSDLLALITRITKAIESAINPDGLTVWWDTGHPANQSGLDFVAEIVPRFEKFPYKHEHRENIAIRYSKEDVDVSNLFRQYLKN